MTQVDWKESLTAYLPVIAGGTGLNTSTRASSAADTVVSLASTSTVILAGNASRLEYIVQNFSAFPVFLARGGVATINRGIMLTPSGGAFIDERFIGTVTAVHGATGTRLLSISEVT